MTESDSPANNDELTDAPEDYAALVGGWMLETLPLVETALHDGTLLQLLEQPEIREVLGSSVGRYYHHLAKAQKKHLPAFRKPWVLHFAREFQSSLQQPLAVFPANPTGDFKSHLSQPPAIMVLHEGKEILLRVDQIFAARGWGIWFEFKLEDLERKYAAALIRNAVSRLQTRIKLLEPIETRPAPPVETSMAVEWDKHVQFRRLLIDVFNETNCAAEEKLDVPEVLLSLPAIQLKGSTHAHVSSETGTSPRGCLNGAPLPGHCLMITPAALARAAMTEIVKANLKPGDFWSSWADEHLDINSIADRLNATFAEAIDSRLQHPLGPMGVLPKPIQDLIRSFPAWHARGAQPQHWLAQIELQRRTTRVRAVTPVPPVQSEPFKDPESIVRQVRAAVEELEAALHDGTLARRIEQPDLPTLLGPALTYRYRSMSAEKVKHDRDFRANWIRRLLDVFEQNLQAPLRTFPAKAATKWNPDDDLPPRLVISDGDEILLRADQAFSAHRWGTWFDFDDEALERFYTAFLIYRALNRLASNIKYLWNIEATFLSGFSRLSADVAWQSGGRGGRFEELMMDILNEEALVARPATLAEDILERTDLRVSGSGITIKEGARVQVSLTAIPELHDRKVRSLMVPEEFVILTPLEFARSAVHPPTHKLFDTFNWDEFWSALGGRRSVHELARQLHALFHDALSIPPRHPLGPMWHIPSPLRKFIRLHTRQRAEKSSKSASERLGFSPINTAHRYTGWYWKQKFSQPTQKDTGTAQ